MARGGLLRRSRVGLLTRVIASSWLGSIWIIVLSSLLSTELAPP